MRDSSRGKRNAKADSRVSIGELMTYEFCSVSSTGLSGNNYVLFRVKMRWFLKSKTFRRHRNCYLTLRFDPPNACLRGGPKTCGRKLPPACRAPFGRPDRTAHSNVAENPNEGSDLEQIIGAVWRELE